MKPSRITAALGIILVGFGIYLFVISVKMGAIIPVLIGASLIYLAFSRGRVATLIFGHTCIVVGAYMITWGVMLPPVDKLTMAHIFFRPLFWGIFSLMGGICAVIHGFCKCVNRQVEMFEKG